MIEVLVAATLASAILGTAPTAPVAAVAPAVLTTAVVAQAVAVAVAQMELPSVGRAS